MSEHVTGISTQVTGASEIKLSPQAQAVLKKSPVEDKAVSDLISDPQKVTPIESSKVVEASPPKVTEEHKKEQVVNMSETKVAGLDIGTMNIISAKQKTKGGSVDFKKIRDVFIDLNEDQVKMLKLSGTTSYIKKDDRYYVLGDDAANIANIFNRNLRTPLVKGVISAGEIEAMEILSVMVGEVLGKSEGGTCYVSSPGDPIDNDFDALYHQAVISDIVANFGWNVKTTSESTAMAFSECSNEQFTGLCLSFGHGMTNLSLVFKTIETIRFSVAMGGSWIDAQAAKVTGKTASQLCAIKEKGINLVKPQGREQAALAIYYKHLIKYVIKNFIEKFKTLNSTIELPEKIPCVVAGGTSLAGGFIDLLKQAINEEKGFPFPISEVRHSQDPLNSIAKGLLIMAQNDDR